jgi:hypothetical protein
MLSLCSFFHKTFVIRYTLLYNYIVTCGPFYGAKIKELFEVPKYLPLKIHIFQTNTL